MAEIGVFKADLSAELLDRLPLLQMLLVDPYHLRIEGWLHALLETLVQLGFLEEH